MPTTNPSKRRKTHPSKPPKSKSKSKNPTNTQKRTTFFTLPTELRQQILFESYHNPPYDIKPKALRIGQWSDTLLQVDTQLEEDVGFAYKKAMERWGEWIEAEKRENGLEWMVLK